LRFFSLTSIRIGASFEGVDSSVELLGIIITYLGTAATTG
jgi:hypothetical protein